MKTIKLQTLRKFDNKWVILLVALNIALIWTAVVQVANLQNLQASTPAPIFATPGPIILIATPAAVVSAVGVNRTHAAVVAYGAPDASTALGAIEAGRVYTVTASYGAAWLQADVAGSGLVWLRAAPLLGRPEGIADLQPSPAPVIVQVYVSSPPILQQLQDNAAPTPSDLDQEAERQQRTASHYANGRP